MPNRRKTTRKKTPAKPAPIKTEAQLHDEAFHLSIKDLGTPELHFRLGLSREASGTLRTNADSLRERLKDTLSLASLKERESSVLQLEIERRR